MLAFAREIALKAGKFLLDNMGELSKSDVSYKGHIDLVTRVDRESEALITSAIRERFPDHGILAEEGARQDTSTEFTWIIDPLDGTTNYVHSFPLYCVSIGVARGNEPVVGVIYAPYTNELFCAESGRGATLNGRPIRVTGTTTLSEGLYCTGFACMRQPEKPDNLGNFIRFLRVCQGVRRGGSAALELAYVAAGRLEGFWELSLSPWDVAAGAVLVREAGGRVTDMQGGDDYLHGRTVLATNGHLHQEMLSMLDPMGRLPEGYA
jgi:myo-inositol-1(or 4)-monophosphatase